jgi:hypothetical protein
MVQDLKCPKCQNSMIQGFIPDYAHGATYVSSWVEGQPKSSLFRYTKTPFGGGTPVAVFRCQGCGFIEFYADDKYAAQ